MSRKPRKTFGQKLKRDIAIGAVVGVVAAKKHQERQRRFAISQEAARRRRSGEAFNQCIFG